jgi:DNA-binding PadR family transcriptional regulator
MKQTRKSSLGLIVLAMLSEEPMHTYRMQRLIEQRGMARVVNGRERTSLYQTIARLLRLGLIEVRETVRGDKHPDRVVYAITNQGRDTAREWLREILRINGAEYPDVPAGVSVLTLLTPDDAREQIEIRAKAVADELAEVDAQLRGFGDLPRLFLLEEEYRRAILAAELAWLNAVVHDLRTGQLTWSDRWLRETAALFTPDTEDPTRGQL